MQESLSVRIYAISIRRKYQKLQISCDHLLYTVNYLANREYIFLKCTLLYLTILSSFREIRENITES